MNFALDAYTINGNVRLLLCVGKTKDARQKCNNNHFKGRSSLKNVDEAYLPHHLG